MKLKLKKIDKIVGIIALIALIFGGVYFYLHYIHVDKEAPVITSSTKLIKCSIDATNKELCKDLTAKDNQDGDLTDQIMVNDIKIKKTKGAKYNEFTISYVVFDAANNMGTFERSLIYTDYTSPKFDITDSLKFTSFSDANLNLQTYLTAEDCIEGDISSQITLDLDSELLKSTANGIYNCSATVENRFGDSSTIPLTIDINADGNNTGISRPAVELSDYIIYVKQGTKIKPKKYIKSIIINNYRYTDLSLSGLPSVSVKSNVNTKKPGTYTVKYSIKDKSSNQIGNATLVVVVERKTESGKK